MFWARSPGAAAFSLSLRLLQWNWQRVPYLRNASELETMKLSLSAGAGVRQAGRYAMTTTRPRSPLGITRPGFGERVGWMGRQGNIPPRFHRDPSLQDWPAHEAPPSSPKSAVGLTGGVQTTITWALPQG